MRRVTALLLVSVTAINVPSGVQAQDPSSTRSTVTDPSPLRTVAFLAGCWEGGDGDVEMREQWSEATGGMMLGTTRYLRNSRVVGFEFAKLAEVEGTVTLQPYPGGERSEHGFPLVSAGEEVVFENLAHDFPVRIVYRRDGADRLAPRIEGADGEARSWELRRAPCPS